MENILCGATNELLPSRPVRLPQPLSLHLFFHWGFSTLKGLVILHTRRRRTAEADAPINVYKVPSRATAGVGGGTTPEYSQIAVPGLLSSTGVALASGLYPFQQQDRTNTISTYGEESSNNRPALRNRQHVHTTRNTRRARTQTAGLVRTRNVKSAILLFIKI